MLGGAVCLKNKIEIKKQKQNQSKKTNQNTRFKKSVFCINLSILVELWDKRLNYGGPIHGWLQFIICTNLMIISWNKQKRGKKPKLNEKTTKTHFVLN